MRILGLDLGGTTGWAIASEDGTIEASGTWDIAPRRGESPGCRYLHLRGHLNEVLAAYDDVALVMYEAAHHRGGAATEYAVGCVTHVQSWCASRRIDHSSVHTATLKRFATGKGNADKSRMMEEAEFHGCGLVRDDNEADAIHVARYGAAMLGSADSRRTPMEAGR